MWAVMAIGLLVATLGQAANGAVGLAIADGVILALVLGIITAVRQRSRRSTPG